MLPCLVSLAEDDDANVREAALPSLVGLIHRITRGIHSFLSSQIPWSLDTKRSVVTPFFRKLVERGMEKKDDRIGLASRYFGELLAYLFGNYFSLFCLHISYILDDMDILDQTWALNSYIKLVSLTKTDLVKMVSARRSCAYNLPVSDHSFLPPPPLHLSF